MACFCSWPSHTQSVNFYSFSCNHVGIIKFNDIFIDFIEETISTNHLNLLWNCPRILISLKCAHFLCDHVIPVILPYKKYNKQLFVPDALQAVTQIATVAEYTGHSNRRKWLASLGPNVLLKFLPSNINHTVNRFCGSSPYSLISISTI